ncbi:MAG: S-layer homology domain-containing protein [Oscillospiraceae bacterium]
MKKSRKLLSVFLTLCLMLTLPPTLAFAQESDFTGDIYVYEEELGPEVYQGYYTCWSGSYEDFDIENTELTWTAFDADNPITSEGEAINRDMYVLDEVYLYFGDLDLGSGTLYAPTEENELNLEGGTLKAAAIDCAYDVWMDAETYIFVQGDITAAEVYSSGCTLDVGGSIIAPDVYFNSSNGPLFVTVGGDIYAYNYDQEGGSVTVAGDITAGYFATSEYETEGVRDDEYCIELLDKYSDYNFTELNVGGSVTAEDGSIYVGWDMYDQEPYNEFSYVPIVVNVAGDMEAGNEVVICEGTITVGGEISTTSVEVPRTIYIYGGNIKASDISSASRIYIGEAYDDYGLNNAIAVDVTGDIAAAYQINVYGGNINAGGTIQTLAGLDTIYIYGGKIEAEAIDSATDIVIGRSLVDEAYVTEDFETEVRRSDDIIIDTGSLTAGDLYIYEGRVFAGTMSCEYAVIDDNAELFDAVNSGAAIPTDGYDVTMSLTTLSGLIPGGMADIYVSYGEGSKWFAATADSNGEVNVWLPDGYTEGEAHYAETSASFTDDDTDEDLSFSVPSAAEEGPAYAAAGIGISVPDTVFSYDGGDAPWGYDDPFDPADFTFMSAGETVSGFSTDSEAYNITVYRNGDWYYCEEIGGFYEGDYIVSVTTEQTIDGTTYIAAGTDEFTVKPLVVTVKANGASVYVGASLPEFKVRVSDNGDGEFADELQEHAGLLFCAESYGTTESRDSYPIYARADCVAYFDGSMAPTSVETEDVDKPVYTPFGNPYFTVYAANIAGIFDEYYDVQTASVSNSTAWGYSVQFNLINGTFNVRTHNTGIDYYSITAAAGAGGSISPSGIVNVAESTSRTFTMTPDEGYVVDDVLVDGDSVGDVTEYVFTSVKAGHTIEVTFTKDIPSEKFTDVDPGLWYADFIDYVVREGLFSGTSDTTFEPDLSMTRGMFATVLYRLAGSPAIAAASPFSDVASGEWYTDAVIWAAGEGIVNGVATDVFGPNEEITREQLVTMLYNYAVYKGYDVSIGEDTNILSYDDFSEISEYAIPAIQWACGAGIIEGRTLSTIVPQGNATRAEVAAILMRFMENVVE